MTYQKTFYQISSVVITDIRYGIVNSSDSSHCKVIIGSQKRGNSKQEEENGAANGPQVRTVCNQRGREGRAKEIPFGIYFVFSEYLW